MENTMFENLSPMEVCKRMSAICQKSADETRPGAEQERLLAAANEFRDEADALAIQDLQLFYHVYHIDAKDETTGLTNFRAAGDALACENAVALMTAGKWPGAELWERGRQVHCAGLIRVAAGDAKN
jgi:hypothetical protein